MTASFQRPHTAAERAELSCAPGLAPSWSTGLGGALGAGVIAFLLFLLGLSFLPTGADIAPRGALIGGLLVGLASWSSASGASGAVGMSGGASERQPWPKGSPKSLAFKRVMPSPLKRPRMRVWLLSAAHRRAGALPGWSIPLRPGGRASVPGCGVRDRRRCSQQSASQHHAHWSIPGTEFDTATVHSRRVGRGACARGSHVCGTSI
jgi:hypothetical protein